ncbi:MAG: GNAT family N-acetyltransferase [Mobilitalea sp.]
MVVKEYENAQMFLNDNESILLEHESVSQLILYNAYQSKKELIFNKGMFGAVCEEENTVLLFCNVPSHNLVIYVVKQDDSAPASIALADSLGNKHVIISGINAKLDICQSFMEQYKKYISGTFAEKLGMDIMEIRQLNDIKPVEGKQRLALPMEAKFVTDWMIQFQLETLTSEMDYEVALKKATKYIEDKKIYLYENSEQKVVSMAVAARKLSHGIAITYVFTPEEYRGKGYAAANLYYLSKEMLAQGYEFCTLFVDKKNPLSNRAYEKVGYKILEDNYEFTMIPTEE